MLNNDFRFQGKAFVFGDNIDTDAIIAANYLVLTDEKEMARHCLAEISPGFHTLVKPGDILVAGDNFGCGSSREHAPAAIKGCVISCVVARSFSRLFYRNAINIGLPAITGEVPPLADGEDIFVDCVTGKIRLVKSGTEISGAPLPEFMLKIISAGGLYGYLEERLKAQGKL